jgi:undecaprenyl-diphosphatase
MKSIKIFIGPIFIVAFAIWTMIITTFDIKHVGVEGTKIGLATVNLWFHSLTGVNLTLYNITDWLGLVPIMVCFLFAVIGIIQLITRKNIFKVDADILLLGAHYFVVILAYLIFEMLPINYRPVLINGVMEASYPSSTTLLVLSVMPTVIFQTEKRIKNNKAKKIIKLLTGIFSAFMVMGRLVSGVHWLTDIVGSILISAGLFYCYKSASILCKRKE